MINRSQYADLMECRSYYAKNIGIPPVDRYAYYLNMMDLAIKNGVNDADANRLRFPHSIRTKQELILIIKIIQEDTKLDMGINPPKLDKKKSWLKWRKK